MVYLFAVVFFFCSCGELREKRYEKDNLRIRELLKQGIEYMDNSHNDSAMICLSEAYELVNPMTEKELLGDLNMNIGYLYIASTENEQAIKYLEYAAAEYQGMSDKSKAVLALLRVARSMQMVNNDNPQVMHYLQKALSLAQGNDTLIGNVYQYMGVQYSRRGIGDSAVYYLEKSTHYPYITAGMSIRLLFLGITFFEAFNELDSAEYYINKALEYPTSIRQRSGCHTMLHRIVVARGDSAEILRRAAVYALYQDSILQWEQSMAKELVDMNDRLEKKENSLTLDRRNLILLVVFGVALLIIALLWLVHWWRARHRERRTQLQQTNQSLLMELDKEKLAARKTWEEELEHLKNYGELADYLHWKDWQSCTQSVNDELNGFFEHLYAEYPDLSEQDQRLCLLVLLDFSAREMAEWLYLSESSIGKTKYRVAQKLGCTSGELREKLMNLLGMGDFEHLSRQESENVHME